MPLTKAMALTTERESWSVCDFAFCNSVQRNVLETFRSLPPRSENNIFRQHAWSIGTVVREYNCPLHVGRSRAALLESVQDTVQERPLLAAYLPLGALGCFRNCCWVFLLNELPSRRMALTTPEACVLFG